MLRNFVDVESISDQLSHYGKEGPFDHVVIDDFFLPNIAQSLHEEFPDFESDVWKGYNSPIEKKRLCNTWDSFPVLTYKVFSALNSPEFVSLLSTKLLSSRNLFSDQGLNGGGWHIHKRGGKLNTHLDYSVHPKLGLQRKLNIIVYVNPDWQENWGGSLGLWGNESAEKPGDLVKSVWSKFNRAVVFDTTQNSWHGLPEPLVCPDGQARQSLAAYYLCDPSEGVDTRGKALFAPTKEQENDEEILDLIKRRSSVASASGVYGEPSKS